MTSIINLYEAARCPTTLREIVVDALRQAGCGALALATPAGDPATTIVCVPKHVTIVAQVIVSEVKRKYGSPLMDAYTGGCLPAEAEGIQ